MCSFELNCFAHSLTLTVGQEVKEIDALDAHNIVQACNKVYKIEKLNGPFDYNLTGKLINKSKGIVQIGNIEITIGNYPIIPQGWIYIRRVCP